MPNKIQIKRGTQANIPTLDVGEFGWSTDTETLFIGNPGGPSNGNIRVNTAQQTYNGTNVGTGTAAPFAGMAGNTLQFRTLAAGNNITLTQTADTITISSTASGGGGTGTLTSASNVGTAGVGVFNQVTGTNLEFKKIKAGSNITVTATGTNEIQLDCPTPGEINTGANIGSAGASSLYLGKSGTTLQFSKLLAGTGVTLATNGSQDIVISASGGGSSSGTITGATNLGTSTGTFGLFKSANASNLEFYNILPGTGVQMAMTANNEVQISAVNTAPIPNPFARYLAGGSGGEEVFVCSQSTLFQGISWSRSGTTMTLTRASHGHSVGDMVIFYGTNATIQNGTIVSVPDANTFTVACSNSGLTFGSSASYMMGFTYQHNATGASKTGGALVAPAAADPVQCISMRVRTGPRTGTVYTLTLPTQNGCGVNTSVSTLYMPVFRCANATSDSLAAISATLTVNQGSSGYNVLSFGNMGSGVDALLSLSF